MSARVFWDPRMGYAYTPGLTVAAHAVLRRIRRLPIRGEVLVAVGQRVAARDVVARADLPGEVHPINLADRLGVGAADVPALMLKSEGDAVKAGEPVARTRGVFGRFQREFRAPIDGAVESVSGVTGQVILRGAPTPLERLAYTQGVVVDVQPGEAATIETRGTLVQGIFGVGGEAIGTLEVAVSGPADTLEAERLGPTHAGKVLVGGSQVSAEAIRKAAALGACAIVTGGLDDADLRDVLGYELGVAITGDETLGITIVVTEGFGRLAMARSTFDLLAPRAGRLASVNGATQIRAGVMRPEVIVPMAEAPTDSAVASGGGVLEVGTRLRAIREPFFGRLGCCTALPVEPATLASEARVRVLEMEFEGGARAIVPRANVELIHD